MQTKLQVGPAGDDFERVADRVADEVMRNLTPTTIASDQEENRISRSVEEGVVGLGRAPTRIRHRGRHPDRTEAWAALSEPLRQSMEGAFGATSGRACAHRPAADGINWSMQSGAFDRRPRHLLRPRTSTKSESIFRQLTAGR